MAGAIFGCGALGLALLVLSNTDGWFSWEYWGNPDGKFDRSVILRNLGLLILAVIALPLAVWRGSSAHKQARSAKKQVKLAEKSLVIDRHQKGAQMLESAELPVRLSGIYALRELVKSDPQECYFMVQDLLCDFVRERSKDRKRDLDPIPGPVPGRTSSAYSAFPPDLQKALETASWLRENTRYASRLEESASWRMDLRGANLYSANLEEVNLSGAVLSSAVLYGANLSKANLYKAYLSRANLSKANLSKANLSKANLYSANLSNANLDEANLCKANLAKADLTKANLSKANLSRVNLYKANLDETNLTNANLYRAYLSKADLSGANLSRANLSDARLFGVKLANTSVFKAKLNNEELYKAWFNQSGRPEGLPDDVKVFLAIRKYGEMWPDFVDRIMQERPELGWSEGDKDFDPDVPRQQL